MTGILQILVPGILVVLSLGALRSASWAVTLLILMYALEQSLQGASPIFRSTPLLTNAWVGVVALLSSMRSIFRIERPFAGYLTISLLLTITIFIWAIASLVWTPARQTAMQMTQSGVPTTALFVIFGVLLVSSIDELGSVARLLLVFGTAVAVSILVNPEFTIVNGRLGINLGYMVRSSALAIGELGGLLVIVAALYRSERLEPLITVMRIVAFAAGTVLGLYSGSRGQLAFAAIVAVGFFPLTQRVKSVFSFFATAIGLIVVAVSLLLLVRLVFRAEGGMIESRWDGATIERGLGVRIANSLDLFLAFANTPSAWVFGLGWNAFASITKAASEPYSHNVYLDILCELGLPMFLLLLVVLRNCASSGLNLFKLVRETRGPRAWVTTFLALAAYHLLLAGKQSFLWATGPLFMHFLLLNRLDLRQREFGWADPPADSLDVSDGQQNPQGAVSAARH